MDGEAGMSGEADFDQADRTAERERQAGIGRVRAALASGRGRLVCDCGAEISEARRRAVPHTDKCIDCATFLERQRRRA
jgi:RNA polymerase-binding transcription factor DksA